MAEDADTIDAEQVEDEEAPSEEETETPEETKPTREGERNIKGLFVNVRLLRRIAQVTFLLGINAYVFSAWFEAEQVQAFWIFIRDILPSIPIIAPLDAPFAAIAGSFGTMNRELTMGLFPFFTIGAMIIILIFFGKASCGWICPIGTLQDFATLPNRSKTRPAPGTEKELRRVKAYVFIITMFFSAWIAISTVLGTDEAIRDALGIFAESGFDPVNPAHILFVKALEMNWPFNIETLWYVLDWGWIFWLQIIFGALVVIVSFWMPRWYCRWLCPAGWLYGIFSRASLVGIGRNPALCTPDTCNVCEVVCPMNIRIRRFPYQRVHSAECIMCLECKSHCPNKAIVIRFG